MEFNLILYGKDEIKENNNKTYYILVIDNIEHEKYMINIFKTFNTKYLGIDFEFNNVSKNKMDVALMQLNLENDTDNVGYIFLLKPTELSEDNYNELINLLTQTHIIKILHGAESLDIPYLFNQLLINKQNINNFCTNFYDTKYLCEYYKIDNNLSDISCGIYNLLLHQNIITKHKLDDLEKIEEMMGPIWLIKIDVYNLKPTLLKYALYDVLFLPELLKKILSYNDIYYTKIIPEITCLIYKYKKEIENQFKHLEKLINILNINYIIINKKKYILHEIWKSLDDLFFDKIKHINYFKNLLKILSKFIIYNNIYNTYDIYSKSNLKINNVNFDFFFKWLIRYEEINKIIIEHNDFIKELIT